MNNKELNNNSLRKSEILVGKIKSGDEKAFTELVHLYSNMVSGVAYKIVGNYETSADITQLVFLKVFDNLWRYDEKRNFTSWLYKITFNLSIDHVRRNRKFKYEYFGDISGIEFSSSESPESIYKKKQLRILVSERFENMSDKQKSAFYVIDILGLRLSEASHILEKPRTTVYYNLTQARSYMKNELKKSKEKINNSYLSH